VRLRPNRLYIWARAEPRPPGLGKRAHLCDACDMKSPIVSIDSEIMGGTPCFVGTRVPIQTLLDYVEAGDSIDEFLDGFPTVSKEQVVAYLEESKRLMLEQVVHACAA
jgi:uncharacterized protein (DUF433 family)